MKSSRDTFPRYVCFSSRSNENNETYIFSPLFSFSIFRSPDDNKLPLNLWNENIHRLDIEISEELFLRNPAPREERRARLVRKERSSVKDHRRRFTWIICYNKFNKTANEGSSDKGEPVIEVIMDFNASSDYYVCDLSSFHSYYSQLHGWISLLVCIFGSIANVLNILVLTRREMRSPTNIILTGLAIADLLVMIDYIPYVIHLYLYRRSRRDTFTYGWTIFVLFHSNFAQVTDKHDWECRVRFT